MQRDYTIPIEYRKISQEWEIEESRETEATITLMGSSQAFRLFEPRTLKISIDLSTIIEGRQVIKLSADMVNIPSNLTLMKIKPEKIAIVAHRLYPREVRISIDTLGHLPNGYSLKKINIEPQSVWVLAPFVTSRQQDIHQYRAHRYLGDHHGTDNKCKTCISKQGAVQK